MNTNNNSSKTTRAKTNRKITKETTKDKENGSAKALYIQT
jgi:hypothetical protein